MSKEAKAEMITQSTILDMGWTKSMIVKLLPEPILKPNSLCCSDEAMDQARRIKRDGDGRF